MLEISKSEDIKNDFPYLDILYLEHPNPRKHPRQTNALRAGQFSPFAALTGFDGQIEEVSRYTAPKIMLSDSEKEKLDEQLLLIQQNRNLPIKVTYFEKNYKKKGGRYLEKTGYFRRVDSVHHTIVFQDKTMIKMQDIVNIEIIELSD